MGSSNCLCRFVFSFFQKRDYRDIKNALFRMSPKSSHCFLCFLGSRHSCAFSPSLLSVAHGYLMNVQNICMYSSENKSHLSALFGKLVRNQQIK